MNNPTQFLIDACEALEIDPETITRPGRMPALVTNRKMVAALMRENGFTQKVIAATFGGKHPSSIFHLLQKHNEHLEFDVWYSRLYSLFQARFYDKNFNRQSIINAGLYI